MSVAALSLDELTDFCIEQTERFRRGLSSDSRFCFEIFRRALLEDLPDALVHIYQIYDAQLRRWVQHHSWFESTGETVDYFINTAISNFYFSLRGQKFARFAGLPQVLSYLKLCVHTAIAQYARDNASSDTSLEVLPESVEVSVDANHLAAAELWKHICDIVVNEQDRRLAHCVFVQGLRPAAIVKMYPHWANEREVSVALQRIRRGLRRDPVLRQWAGLEREDVLP